MPLWSEFPSMYFLPLPKEGSLSVKEGGVSFLHRLQNSARKTVHNPGLLLTVD